MNSQSPENASSKNLTEATAPASDTQTAPMDSHGKISATLTWMRRHRVKSSLIVLGVFLAIGTSWALHIRSGHFSNTGRIDLSRPDAVISSQNLADLPKDILSVPILKAALTEDALFFYETDEDWLGIKGTLRRLTFEHDLTLQDKLFANIAREPAEVLLWRDGKGALRHWAIALERSFIGDLSLALAKIKFNLDKQITQIGEVDGAPVLAIKLSSRRELALVSQGNHVVVLSSTELLSGKDNELNKEARTFLKQMLDQQQSRHRHATAKFGIDWDKPSGKHTLLVSNRFLAQGYGELAPTVQAVRFDFDGQAWQTQVQLLPNAVTPALNKIWQQVPAKAVACAATTLDWQAIDGVLKTGRKVPTGLPSLAHNMAGPAAVCWYPEHDISAPLFTAIRAEPDATAAATNKSQAGAKDAASAKQPLTSQHLFSLFDWAIGRQAPAADAKNKTEVNPATILEKASPGLTTLARNAPILPDFNPALGFSRDAMYFSVDGRLVHERAEQVARKVYPTMADVANNRTVLLYAHPARLMALIDVTAKRHLTQEEHRSLRAAWDYQMPRRIRDVSAFPPLILAIADEGKPLAKPNPAEKPSGLHDAAPRWVAAEWLSVAN